MSRGTSVIERMRSDARTADELRDRARQLLTGAVRAGHAAGYSQREIGDALDQLAALHRHLSRGDLADETGANAVSMGLAAAIEALSGNENPIGLRIFGTDWAIIWATRNRIAHGYATIDRTMIQATVDHDLPEFEARLKQASEKHT